MARRAVAKFGLKVSKACELFGLSRTTYYSQSEFRRIQRDAALIEALNKAVDRHFSWGFWKCFNKLRMDGNRWNHKRCHRVYCEMKLNMPRRTKKRVITRPKQPLIVFDQHNRGGRWTLSMMPCTTADDSECSTSSMSPIAKPWLLNQVSQYLPPD